MPLWASATEASRRFSWVSSTAPVWSEEEECEEEEEQCGEEED